MQSEGKQEGATVLGFAKIKENRRTPKTQQLGRDKIKLRHSQEASFLVCIIYSQQIWAATQKGYL